MSNEFKQITPFEMEGNVFKEFGKDWCLITAEKDGKVNTMTAAWGGYGVMWNKNVAHVVIRPQRYTKEFVDYADSFSLTFFDESFKKKLAYLGTASGRDEDKIAKCDLHTVFDENIPYFEESNLVVFCKKLYASEIVEEGFIEKNIIDECYPDKDFHVLYFAEITKILKK